ncbi:hypothetical protein, partial [Cecembia lonarensis]|uniref:hypothetical protein n=1 Tax=Cecembia lonarensis TaxID=645110 RepID=UPI00058BB808
RYIFKHKSPQKPVRSGTQEARIKMKWDFGGRKSEVGFHDDFLLFPFIWTGYGSKIYYLCGCNLLSGAGSSIIRVRSSDTSDNRAVFTDLSESRS